MDERMDTTWDEVMKRNSNTNKSPVDNGIERNLVDNSSEATYAQLGENTLRNEFRNQRLLQDPCNDSGWMDFLQILVHQHAKTIVHLQELSAEVEKLKDFRSSFISSITGDLGKSSSSAGPSHSHLHQTKDVWTSSPHKLIDSGFSTETKESGNQKEDEDPLYSLLDIIQTKVSNSTSTLSHPLPLGPGSSCTCKRINNGTRSSGKTLGRLDKVLGFKSGIGENVHLGRSLIRAILREVETLELQRQLLFAAANVKTLESQLGSLEFEDKNSSRLASKYLALSHENEQLRFKLKEQEIQLEGTKAKLRILEKIQNQSTSTSLKLSLVPLEDSLPKESSSNGNNHSCPPHPLHSFLHSDSSTGAGDNPPEFHQVSEISSPTTDQRKIYPDPHIIIIQSDEVLLPTTSSPPSTFLHSTRTTTNCSDAADGNSKTKVVSESNDKNELPLTPPLLLTRISKTNALGIVDCTSNKKESNNYYSKSSIHNCSRTNVSKCELSDTSSSRARALRGPGVTKIPTRPQSSQILLNENGLRKSSLLTNNTASTSPSSQQSISSSNKSPGSSISSKSSIPVAISRLKRVGSERNVVVNKSKNNIQGLTSGPNVTTVGLRKQTNFWTSWFAPTT